MPTIPTAIITVALVCYSIGVWSERISGRLTAWHLVFFWMGLIFDTWGTGMMMEQAGGLSFGLHSTTGVIAIVLMLVHAIWATIVLANNNERWITRFHRFSVAVWLIWLVPYMSPMFVALG
jgi:uncharacterized repeat protein (TIGR03987 family)